MKSICWEKLHKIRKKQPAIIITMPDSTLQEKIARAYWFTILRSAAPKFNLDLDVDLAPAL